LKKKYRLNKGGLIIFRNGCEFYKNTKCGKDGFDGFVPLLKSLDTEEKGHGNSDLKKLSQLRLQGQ
jgi:hypothetical protein